MNPNGWVGKEMLNFVLCSYTGLCGSYNNRAEDDFMSSQNILEKTSQTFADSWEMMSCPKGKPTSCISIEKGNAGWMPHSVIKYLLLGIMYLFLQ